MNPADYIVLVCYVIGVFIVGGIFGARIKSSGDMFAAGNQSPWWLAGLSGFMTMFSAGTFVVWGSIAYQHGLVAIVINLTYGVAALSVGWFVAGRWRSLGLTTAAEFLELRFGKPALLFYYAGQHDLQVGHRECSSLLGRRAVISLGSSRCGELVC